MRLGLFGGTLDPIHYGHLRAAEEIREGFPLDRIVFIPSANPPHKKEAAVAPFHHRLTMVRMAARGNPHFEVSDIESKRAGKSYSVDTLRYFKERYGEQIEIYFVLGVDAFLDIRTWKDYEELFCLSNFIVVSRPGFSFGSLDRFIPRGLCAQFRFCPEERRFSHSSGHSVFLKDCTALDISATLIRSKKRAGASIRYLVPPAIERYIELHRLYHGDDE